MVSTMNLSPIPLSRTNSLTRWCWKDLPWRPLTGMSSKHSIPLPSSSLGMYTPVALSIMDYRIESMAAAAGLMSEGYWRLSE
jgi:hypothetical protein